MRIINFSADGILSAVKKGFFDWLEKQDADLICIQDLRAQERELNADIFYPQGYFPYFFDTPDGSNGVAIYTKKLPKAIMTGLGFNDFDAEARYIQADFEDISIGSILVPHTTMQSDNSNLERKASFLADMATHLEKITKKRRSFVFAGNWHMAHNSNDTQQEKSNDQPGFLLEEQRWLDTVTHQLGYVDAFRVCNPDNDEFSWWPNADKSDGWRTDFQLVSANMVGHIEYATIYKGQDFSSHAPVIIDYEYILGRDDDGY